VRVAYKAFPLDFHSHAMVAALAAKSAQEQGKFWEFHDLLFRQRGLDMQQLDAYAREVGARHGPAARGPRGAEVGLVGDSATCARRGAWG
jgi:protein-disulfide isomerase